MTTVFRRDDAWQSAITARLPGFGASRGLIGAITCLGLCALLPSCAGFGGPEKSEAETEYVVIPPPPEKPPFDRVRSRRPAF